ncbi:ribbon-helix-helix domain-containing protein [Sphaerothrix gracilis]
MFSDDQTAEMAKVTITAFVEEELKEGLKALADHERRSMSQMAAVLIERAVEEARQQGIIPPVETSSESK